TKSKLLSIMVASNLCEIIDASEIYKFSKITCF
ncbi:unnamed protein product, partial [marine sediment metagenome]